MKYGKRTLATVVGGIFWILGMIIPAQAGAGGQTLANTGSDTLILIAAAAIALLLAGAFLLLRKFSRDRKNKDD